MTLNWALCAQCMHRVSCFLYASSWFCNEETVFSSRSFHRPRKREDRMVNKTLNMCQGVFWARSHCVIISCELLNDVWKRCKREIFERYEGVKTNRERQFVSLNRKRRLKFSAETSYQIAINVSYFGHVSIRLTLVHIILFQFLLFPSFITWSTHPSVVFFPPMLIWEMECYVQY